MVAPEIHNRCKSWKYNDRDGLNESDATALADILEERLKSVDIAAFAPELEMQHPDEPFIRNDRKFAAFVEIRKFAAFVEIREFAAFVDAIRKFAAFARYSGGFSIW
jgi:hypothetical protein